MSSVFSAHQLCVAPAKEHDLASDEQLASIEAQKRTLYTYYQQAIQVIPVEERDADNRVVVLSEQYLKRFFRALPRNFETFFKLYVGYVHREEDYVHSYNPWGSFSPATQQRRATFDTKKFNRYSHDLSHILPGLAKVIPEEVYYAKLLAMGCGGKGGGGFWGEANSDLLQEYLRDLICQNIALSAQVLAQKTDNEIAGLFYYLYDGPHPDHPALKKDYEELYEKLMAISPRVARLLKVAYEKLLSEEHCPGH